MKPVQQPTSEQKFRILLLSAMTKPLAAAVVAITIIVGLMVSYWFFAVGAAFYIFIVYSSLQDPIESRQVLDEALYAPQRDIIWLVRASTPELIVEDHTTGIGG